MPHLNTTKKTISLHLSLDERPRVDEQVRRRLLPYLRHRALFLLNRADLLRIQSAHGPDHLQRLLLFPDLLERGLGQFFIMRQPRQPCLLGPVDLDLVLIGHRGQHRQEELAEKRQV